MGATTTPEFEDERLTTIGLLFESAAGLRRLFHRQLESTGAASSQAFDILIRLARSEGGELRMSELAVQASLTPSGLTRAVDRLQEQGLVDRRTCPEDRRGSFALLTPAGRALMDETIPDHIAAVDRILDELFTPEEEARLADSLRRLRDYAFEQNAAYGCPSGEEPSDGCPG
ncbi:MAG: MarR family transcriptional regulator [Acidimicrobiales bacterium]|jgi:DNA-binding MarR family transcriptional regulator